MEVFIIRVYRNDRKKDKKSPHSLVGTVEEVTTRQKKAFRDFDELWDILHSTEDRNLKKPIVQETNCGIVNANAETLSQADSRYEQTWRCTRKKLLSCL